MHITDLNECLAELPEISVLELFRARPPGASFRWTGEEAIDGGPSDLVGPICVDEHAIEYVVRPVLNGATVSHAEVCRVTRPNNTLQFRDMTRSRDVPASVKKALIAFVSGPAWRRAAAANVLAADGP